MVARARAIWIISVGEALSTQPSRQLALDVHQLALLQGGAQGLTEKGHSLSDRVLELVLGTASRFVLRADPSHQPVLGPGVPPRRKLKPRWGHGEGAPWSSTAPAMGSEQEGALHADSPWLVLHYSPGL